MAEEELVPKDFVYCGLRLSNKDTLIGKIVFIDADGNLGEPALYERKMFPGRVLGGVYTGASFGNSAARGLQKVIYQKKYDDWMQIQKWVGEHEQAQFEYKCIQLEKKMAKEDDLAKALIPWRKLYTTYVMQHDMLSAEALVQRVKRILRKPV